MDFSQLSVIAASLTTAKQIGQAALGIRDFNLIADQIASINEQLLKAQDALLAHNASMFQLQNENFEAREELRKLKESLSERGRYSLVEVTSGQFAYGMNQPPLQSGSSDPRSAQPMHYLCQPCMDKGIKMVLNSAVAKLTTGYTNVLLCPGCKHSIKAS